jgi:DNA-directed RNA polymerase specialized sigma24 family protein
LRFWDGLTAREISEILKIRPYNKVYSILNRALKILREKSEKEKYI